MSTNANEGKCMGCGEDDSRVLKQYHHIYGRNNGPETIILCHNCHDKTIYDQNKFPPNKRNKKSIGNMPHYEDVSIGSLLELLGKRLKKRGMNYGNRTKSV